MPISILDTDIFGIINIANSSGINEVPEAGNV